MAVLVGEDAEAAVLRLDRVVADEVVRVADPGAAFTWSGTQTITRKAEWPAWTPPPEMIARQPYLPRHMAGGPGNPLGARAMYLGGTIYRIHGANAPDTIGTRVSSGCLRLTNEDVKDLYSRVSIGAQGDRAADDGPPRRSRQDHPLSRQKFERERAAPAFAGAVLESGRLSFKGRASRAIAGAMSGSG